MASFLSKFIRSGAAAAGDLYADKAMAQMRDELMAKREAVLEENRRASQLEQREYQEGQQAEDREFRKGETAENRAYQEGQQTESREYQASETAKTREYRDSQPASPQDQLAQLKLEQAKKGGSDQLDPKEVRIETNRLLNEQKENAIEVGDDDYKDHAAMSEIAKQQLITNRAAPKGSEVVPELIEVETSANDLPLSGDPSKRKTNLKTVTTQEDYDKLKPGEEYIDSETGKRSRKR